MATATQTAAAAVEKSAKRRPYVIVFVTLAVVTLIEVNLAIVLAPLGFDVRGSGYIAILIILAIVKATLVASYYMHLRYEPRWLMFIPFACLGLVGILVLALLGTPATPPPPVP